MATVLSGDESNVISPLSINIARVHKDCIATILWLTKITVLPKLEIDYLKGNPKKAFRELKYKLKHSFKDLVKDMLDSDISILKKNK